MVTTVAAADGWLRLAVTVAVPPSAIESSFSANVTLETSSSSMVSVRLAGFATPLPPLAVAEIVTDLSSESTGLLFVVTCTKPRLAVEPFGMFSVVFVLNLKSDATAPVPAVAATVSVTSSLDTLLRVAVTVARPRFSEIELLFSASVTVGNVSSSSMVSVTSAGLSTLSTFVLPDKITDLFDE